MVKIYKEQPKKSVRLFAIILCLYFIFSPFEFRLTTDHGSLLKFIAIVFAIVSVPYVLKSGRFIKYSDPIIWCLVLLIVFSYLSVFWTIDIEATLKMNLTYMFLQAMFLVVYILRFNVKEQYFIRKAILLGGILVSIYILVFSPELLTYSPGGRVALGEADPNEFAALLILPLFISFEEIINSKKIYVVLFVSLLFLILSTGSRGALIAIIFAFLYFLFFKFKFKFKHLIMIIILGLGVFFSISFFLPDYLIERLSGGEDIISTLEFGGGRTAIWEIIFDNIIRNIPFLGFGSGSSSIILGQYFGRITGSHNTYLMLLLEFGVLGLSIFLYFLWAMFKKYKNDPKFSKILSFIAILIIVFFLDSYFKKYLWNILMYLVISDKITQSIATVKPVFQLGKTIYTHKTL